MGVWKNFNIDGWVRHNEGGRSKNGGGLVYSKVILVPQKMLNKTSNLKMAVCKAASRRCNQNP